jgi:hypothetical protein
MTKENKNISLYIDNILIDIFYHDDESFVNEYAYKLYILRINSLDIEPQWNKAAFITMWRTYEHYFYEAKKILRKLKIKKIYDI